MGHHHHGGGYYGGSGNAALGHNKNMTSSMAPHQQSSYEVWSNFFLSAGIPSNVVHDYAVTFSQHRIRIDMLKEITKDILLEMGIKAMGDIIAILRHAKSICTQDELKTTGMVKQIPASTSMASHIKSSANQSPSVTTITTPNSVTTKHLSQRMPITTNRSSLNLAPASTSSGPGTGTKIQSRLNMNSGALIASSSSLASAHHISDSNKRSNSSISNSLAKRLRPAPNEAKSNLNLSEKTLTVHYPPLSAIAKAAQRISNSNATPN